MKLNRCGYIAVIGRPNAGKSTLLNAILGKKWVITSKKAQTTRHTILGIKTHDHVQAVYIDTPGYRDIAPGMLHKHLNRAAAHAAFDVDILIWVVDASRWTEDDEAVLALVKRAKSPTILVLNKVDLIKAKYDLLPMIQEMQKKHDFLEIVPLSAKINDNVLSLEKALEAYLPEQDFLYPEEQESDRPLSFFYSEMIREKVMRFLGEEVPYSVAVEIEKTEENQGILHIFALLWVERDGQKAILIGENGDTLKKIGTESRKEIEKFLNKKVFLKLWVKVKGNWTNDEGLIHSLL